LAKPLPGILVQDRAPKTILCYVREYQTWKKWPIQCDVTALPADPGVFALYLVHLIQQGSSVSLLNSAIYRASWVHKKSGYLERGDHPLVQQVAEAGRRILAKPLNRKKALEVSRQGGWPSEKSKNNYIQEFLELLLKVSKAIQG